MIEFAKRNSRRAIAEKRQEFEARLAKIKQEEERLKAGQDSSERPRKKQVRPGRSQILRSHTNQLNLPAIGRTVIAVRCQGRR